MTIQGNGGILFCMNRRGRRKRVGKGEAGKVQKGAADVIYSKTT